MAQHFSILSAFRARSESPAFSIKANEEDKWMVAKLLIKVADTGHSSLSWEHHCAWAYKVSEEFYKQVDHRMWRFTLPFVMLPMSQISRHFHVLSAKRVHHSYHILELLNLIICMIE